MKFNSVMKSGLAALMSLSLVACGGSSASTSTGGSATGTAAFKLGGTGPTTGDAAIYGQAVENGAKLAVEAVNAAGKVALEFNFQDDQADGEKASTAYNTLIDWGMQVSIGATTSGAGQALSPLFVQDDIFAITPSGSSTAVINQNQNKSCRKAGNHCVTGNTHRSRYNHLSSFL
jgi:branched-chain amino acid transport system substrate-binding protein